MSAVIVGESVDARTALLLAMADDELVIGHRHSHWTGVAPSLEEDLAFASIAQDEINHADVWYQLIVGQDRAAVDALGLGRSAHEYRHAVLCERPPGDFAYTLARQFLYDHFDAVRLSALASSRDPDIAAVATKLQHEERFHLEHADEWIERLGRGDDSRGRLRDALHAAWGEALWLFEPVPGEAEAVERGLVSAPMVSLVAMWVERLQPVLDDAGVGDVLDIIEVPTFRDRSGRYGLHTIDWPPTWEEMTFLYRGHPGARW